MERDFFLFIVVVLNFVGVIMIAINLKRENSKLARIHEEERKRLKEIASNIGRDENE